MKLYPVSVYAALHMCRILSFDETLESLMSKKKEASLASTITQFIESQGYQPIEGNPYSQLDAFFNEIEVKQERRRVIVMFRERGLVQVIRAITCYVSSDEGIETVASSRVYLIVNGKVKQLEKQEYSDNTSDAEIEERILTLYDGEVETFKSFSISNLSLITNSLYDVVPKGQKHDMVKMIIKLVDAACLKNKSIMVNGKYVCTDKQRKDYQETVLRHAVDSYFAYLNGEEGKDMQYILGFTSFLEKYFADLINLDDIKKKLVLWHEFHNSIFNTLTAEDGQYDTDPDISELFEKPAAYKRAFSFSSSMKMLDLFNQLNQH